MPAISRSRTKIYIVDADTTPSTGLTSSDVVVGEIKSYSKSGGERDVESDPLFGGFVDKDKPRSQFEIELEVVPQTGANAYNWEALIYGEDGTNTGIYTTASDASDKMIVIEADDGTNQKSWAFNNCNGITIDTEGNADDNQTATLTFKFAPTTSSGVPNYQYGAVAAASLADWSTLDTE